MSDNLMHTHPIFLIMEKIAGLGWTLGDIDVEELAPVNDFRHFRIETEFDHAEFMCGVDICEVASGSVGWTKRIECTPIAVEVDMLRCHALRAALESYLEEMALPKQAMFIINWMQFEEDEVYDLDFADSNSTDPFDLSECEIAKRIFSESRYSIHIGPQISLAGGDRSDWRFGVRPRFTVTNKRYKRH